MHITDYFYNKPKATAAGKGSANTANPAFWATAAVAAITLSGCVLAPGMSAGKSYPRPGFAGDPLQRSTFGPAESDHSQSQLVPQNEASSTLIRINPSLINQLRQEKPKDVSLDVKSLFGKALGYTIGPGDVLNIVVWDHPEIAPRTVSPTVDAAGVLVVPGYNVDPEGIIQFPYVGTVQLAGLSELKARDKLANALGKFFKNPQVTLQMQAYRSGRIYVEGEVRSPGLQAINDIPMTLPIALGRAGSLLSTGDRSAVTLTRNGVTTRIDMQQLSAQGIDPSSILLRDGDVLRIPARDDSRVYVLGEVLRSGPQLLRNGRLTLSQALGDAGGLNVTSGDPRQIYVVRNGASGSADVYHLDASSTANYALADGFELRASDVVFVDPVPLANWNRVVSLILPSAQTARITREVVNIR